MLGRTGAALSLGSFAGPGDVTVLSPARAPGPVNRELFHSSWWEGKPFPATCGSWGSSEFFLHAVMWAQGFLDLSSICSTQRELQAQLKSLACKPWPGAIVGLSVFVFHLWRMLVSSSLTFSSLRVISYIVCVFLYIKWKINLVPVSAFGWKLTHLLGHLTSSYWLQGLCLFVLVVLGSSPGLTLVRQKCYHLIPFWLFFQIGSHVLLRAGTEPHILIPIPSSELGLQVHTIMPGLFSEMGLFSL